jgi:hypothetical protein
LFDVHLNGPAFGPQFSHRYVSHEYFTHAFEVRAVKSNWNRDFMNGYSDLYVRVSTQENPASTNDMLDAASWQRQEALPGVWYAFRRGGDQATGQHDYGRDLEVQRFCRPRSATTRFAVYDRDNTTDDLLGEVTLAGSADYADGLDLGGASLRFVYDVR